MPLSGSFNCSSTAGVGVVVANHMWGFSMTVGCFNQIQGNMACVVSSHLHCIPRGLLRVLTSIDEEVVVVGQHGPKLQCLASEQWWSLSCIMAQNVKAHCTNRSPLDVRSAQCLCLVSVPKSNQTVRAAAGVSQHLQHFPMHLCPL